MKLVFTCHHFPHIDPAYDVRAGAEMFARRLFDAWIAAGHSVTVVDKRKKVPACRLGGIEIVPWPQSHKVFTDADLLMTHLDVTPETMDLARYWNKPLVHLIHNNLQVAYFDCWDKADFYLFCANWVARESQGWIAGTPWQVCYPLVFSPEWKTAAGLADRDIVLLSNCNENKGGDLLSTLAQLLPQVKFVGIVGAYEEQFIVHDLPNLEYVPHTADVKKWYNRARVVICPSKYESWGRVAAEAMASGIPIVVSGTAGLRESVGDGGQFVELSRRNVIDEWTVPIQKLYTDDDWWHHWSRKARLRMLRLDAIQEQQLEAAIFQLEWTVANYRQKRAA